MRYAHLWMSAKLLFSATSYIPDMVPGRFVAGFSSAQFSRWCIARGTVGRPPQIDYVRTDRKKPLS